MIGVPRRNDSLNFQIQDNTITYFANRLNLRTSVEWAASLRDDQVEEKEAIKRCIDLKLTELTAPYREAWFWILESWATKPKVGDHTHFGIQRWIKGGGVNGEVLRQIVETVRPWPQAKNLIAWQLYGGRAPPENPRQLNQLLHMTIKSGKVVSLQEVGLSSRGTTSELFELLSILESALAGGLQAAKRVGWLNNGRDLTNYDVKRVYPIDVQADGTIGSDDPDKYREGFAACTKLLFAVADRLATSEPEALVRCVQHWRLSSWNIFRRLWAAIFRRKSLGGEVLVEEFVLKMSDAEFWKHHDYPEFTELRAIRFPDMSLTTRLALESRIKKRPPASFWKRNIPAVERNRYRLNRAATEMQRLRTSGEELSPNSKTWLTRTGVDVSEVESAISGFITSSPDYLFDRQEEEIPDELLDALPKIEGYLSHSERDSQLRSAESYVERNVTKILGAVLSAPFLAETQTKVFRVALTFHRPMDGAISSRADLVRLAILLQDLPDKLFTQLVSVIPAWLAAWLSVIRDPDLVSALWLRAWPWAVEATNKANNVQSQEESKLANDDDEREAERDNDRLVSDALNTPAGELISVFLRMCPNLKVQPTPFFDGALEIMRQRAIEADGATRLVVLHRFLSSLEYMRNADEPWTRKYLLERLRHDLVEEIEIWDAIARNNVLSPDTMEIIGERMARIAQGGLLPESTRARLAERVVYRVLLDRAAGISQSVPDTTIQQMLRLGSDRLRAKCAQAMGLLLDVDILKGRTDRFKKVVGPFIDLVWPKERTLRSRSLSRSFAKLPAKSGGAFSQAVDLIERYLVPFDCWSLSEYELFGKDVEAKEIKHLRGKVEAEALLKLLDLTIGTGEGVIRPYDLDRALAEMRRAYPKITRDERYARLTALVRKRF